MSTHTGGGVVRQQRAGRSFHKKFCKLRMPPVSIENLVEPPRRTARGSLRPSSQREQRNPEQFEPLLRQVYSNPQGDRFDLLAASSVSVSTGVDRWCYIRALFGIPGWMNCCCRLSPNVKQVRKLADYALKFAIRFSTNITLLISFRADRVREIQHAVWALSFGAKHGQELSGSSEPDLTEQKDHLMSKKFAYLSAAAIGAAALLATAALPASAATTDTTFVVDAGTIGFSTIAATADIGPEATGTTSVTGSLGAVTVADNRGGTTAWNASAISTTFARTGGGADSTSTAVSYNSGAVTSTGTVTPASAGATTMSPTIAANVVTTTLVSGNNTASFTPTLTVTMPASALAGTYIGTVTTSVA